MQNLITKLFILWATQKYQNLVKFIDLKIYIVRSRSLSFLYRSKYKVFEYDFLHIYQINSQLHTNIFIKIFKLINIILIKKELLVSIWTKSSL
jgi:hypothetical protein